MLHHPRVKTVGITIDGRAVRIEAGVADACVARHQGVSTAVTGWATRSSRGSLIFRISRTVMVVWPGWLAGCAGLGF
jgi:hypothetical protein